MKRLKWLYGFWLYLAVVSCTKEQVVRADFTFSYQQQPCFVPCLIVFTPSSNHAKSQLWDFGDGTQSTARFPEPKVYDRPGNYEVSLSVVNEDGAEDRQSRRVAVLPTPDTLLLERVFIHKIPLFAPGNVTWDPGSPPENWPDLFFAVQDDRAIRSFENSTFSIPDVDTNNLPVRWVFEPPVVLSPLNKTYYLEIYDNDAPSSALRVDYIRFRPADYQQRIHPYPTRIELTRDTTFAINLELRWK